MAEHEPLTDDECEVAFDLWLARMKGLAGALKPEFYPAAVALCETGLAALDLNGLRRDDPADLN
jgi:hypothetical protein